MQQQFNQQVEKILWEGNDLFLVCTIFMLKVDFFITLMYVDESVYEQTYSFETIVSLGLNFFVPLNFSHIL